MYAANHFPGVKAIIALTESGHAADHIAHPFGRADLLLQPAQRHAEPRDDVPRVYTIPFAPSDYEPADLSNAAIDELRKRNLVQSGDWVILTKGDFYRDSGGTNGMKILLVD